MLYVHLGLGPLVVSSESMYYFNQSHLHLSDITDADPYKTLQVYCPSNTEAKAWLEQYKAWCANFEQPENEDIIKDLTDHTVFKQPLLEAVDQISAKFENNLNKDMYFTSSLKFKVNGDRRTRDNIQDLITFFDAQQQEGKISYRDYDNKEQKLTKENLQTILVEHVTNGQNLYKQKWEKQQKIQAAQSFDDLKAVSTEFEMSDFTGGQNNGLIPLG